MEASHTTPSQRCGRNNVSMKNVTYLGSLTHHLYTCPKEYFGSDIAARSHSKSRGNSTDHNKTGRGQASLNSGVMTDSISGVVPAFRTDSRSHALSQSTATMTSAAWTHDFTQQTWSHRIGHRSKRLQRKYYGIHLSSSSRALLYREHKSSIEPWHQPGLTSVLPTDRVLDCLILPRSILIASKCTNTERELTRKQWSGYRTAH